MSEVNLYQKVIFCLVGGRARRACICVSEILCKLASDIVEEDKYSGNTLEMLAIARMRRISYDALLNIYYSQVIH